MKFNVSTVLPIVAVLGFVFCLLLAWFQPDTRAALLPLITSAVAAGLHVANQTKNSEGCGTDGADGTPEAPHSP